MSRFSSDFLSRSGLHWDSLSLWLGVAFSALLFPCGVSADDEVPVYPPPSAAEILQIEAKSAQLLAAVVPAPGGLFNTAQRPRKILQMADGTVYWGNLFGRAQILALTDLAPAKPPENDWDNPPQYLSLYGWEKGHWVFRQFLGNASDLAFHQHQGTHFMQGSYREGRYEGEFLSWLYDPRAGKLVETHFEDWGPFYLAGDFLVCTRGFERRAHLTSHTIYAYQDHRRGSLVAQVDESDTGRFIITSRNPANGKMECWFFVPGREEGGHLSVTVYPRGKSAGKYEWPSEAGAPLGTAAWEQAGESDWSTGAYLQLLTGLNPKVLDDQWLEELPAPSPAKLPHIEATGDAEIVNRLKGPARPH